MKENKIEKEKTPYHEEKLKMEKDIRKRPLRKTLGLSLKKKNAVCNIF